jgi:hypothetical protein
MTETLNVNVLVAAKEEYTKQLDYLLFRVLFMILLNRFIHMSLKKTTFVELVSYSNFQKELKAVPNWASFKLDEKLHAINSKYPYLMDLVTAIFVSHVKILACVRLKSDDKSVKIKVPNLNTFLHKIIINCSECIYYTPDIIEDNKTKIFEIINTSINETIANQIPIEYILNEYLSGVFDEEEPAYPDNEDVVEQEPDLNEYSDEEVDDDADVKKNIPIIPIQKPISKKIEPGTLKDELPFNKPEEDLDPESDPEIEDFKDLKNKKDNAFKINKQEEIEDDSEEEEVSDDEDDKKEPTLF